MIMSVRNYNSSRSYGRFNEKKQELKNRRKKNIDYTQVYKEAIPPHDIEALRQIGEKREKHQRMQNIIKRKRERDELVNAEKKAKKNNNINEKKRKLNTEFNIEKIMKKNRRKIVDSLL